VQKGAYPRRTQHRGRPAAYIQRGQGAGFVGFKEPAGIFQQNINKTLKTTIINQ
jgi:hypothetical protein